VIPVGYSQEGSMDPIRVIYERDEESWVATSPDVDGWTAVGTTYEEAQRLAEQGVRFALDRDDVELKHFVPAGTAKT
jgi:predicted RNase H-like HicB family nuclease